MSKESNKKKAGDNLAEPETSEVQAYGAEQSAAAEETDPQLQYDQQNADLSQAATEVDPEGEKLDLEKSEIEYGRSAVAVNPKQNLIILFAAVIVVGLIAYYFIFSGSKKDTQPKSDFPLSNQKPAQAKDIPVPVVSGGSFASGSAISPDKFKEKDLEPIVKTKVEAPQVMLPPPPVFPTSVQPAIIAPAIPPAINSGNQSSQEITQKQQKIKSSMILVSGGTAAGASRPGEPGKPEATKRDLDQSFIVQPTTAVSTKLTFLGNMSSVIVQGKVIEAVLETPINTNFPGPIRAVISRDVFSEQGENILIPKGSRVVGKFDGGYQAGKDRVVVKWDRIILPDGHDIMMQDAPGADSLGMLGIPGHVNREFFSTIGNALLLSVINVGTASIMEKAFKTGSTSTTSTVDTSGNQTTTSTNSPTQQAANQQVTALANTTQQWAKSNFLSVPSITIDQGTLVKIFVNQDVLFPKDIASGIKVVR